jgi:methylphosphotriester-DNA--protein-cysteine methyltransferase
MTRTTLDGHVDRISSVVALMAERPHEDKTPKLDELAAAAAMSKFHFHRVFRLLTDETCAGAAQPDTRITEAAMLAGHSSSQAFAKAVKDALAVPA